MAGAAQRVWGFDAHATTPGAFLNVTRSVRGQPWRDRLAPHQAGIASAISQRHGLADVLGRVLAARGATLEDIDLRLNPTIKALMPDPSVLRDCERLAERLALAITRGERVAVFGDYDVDGACSSALMARFLAHHGRACEIYIPDRITEGYGPTPQAIETLIGHGAQLIITVDCGTTSFQAFQPAIAAGVDVLVIDHHQATDALPEVFALVNPNRQDDLSGLGHLCAAGVVFVVLVAVARVLRQQGYYAHAASPPELLSLLDLVALATVADVVPLEGLNRAFVAKGLPVLHRRENLGLRALCDCAGLKTAPTPYHLGFVLGPRINAGGRIGDAGMGARLLSTTDGIEAGALAATLDRLNGERKAMEAQTLDQALAQVSLSLEAEPDQPLLMVGSQDWHKGLVGLVASRLTERYRRPSVVIAWTEDGTGTGSARSIAGVDLGRAVLAAVDAGLLIKGGGHAMAAGLTLARDRFEEVRDFLASRMADSVLVASERAGLDIDGALTPRSVTPEFLDLLDQAGPFGAGNPQPRFAFAAHHVVAPKEVGDGHIRCQLKAGDGSRIDAVAFRAGHSELGPFLQGRHGLATHIAGHLRRDSWGGRNRVEVVIEDAADPRG